jgi:hypothetical protein
MNAIKQMQNFEIIMGIGGQYSIFQYVKDA